MTLWAISTGWRKKENVFLFECGSDKFQKERAVQELHPFTHGTSGDI